jgi:lipid II:glycine glycyltransferase (peptidoglycan interpeptide bridge formation enzyme)
LRVVALRDIDAARQHVQASNASVTRRRMRGEHLEVSEDSRSIVALLQSGAARLYQALQGDALMSSILLLESSRVAYYHSAGTNPEGTQLGASAFLIAETAADLRKRGYAEFNLGGAEPENPGLHRFKSGFGAQARSLETTRVVCVGPVKRGLRSLARALRSHSPA